MSVLDRFHRPIRADQLTRGQQLVTEGDVQLHDVTEGSIGATVYDGANRLDTLLKWQPGSTFGYSCQCPVFRSGTTCSHVIATALAADRQGLLPSDNGHTAQHETVPRRRERSMTWLSATGQLRRADGEDEPRPVVHHQPSLPSWRKLIERVKQEERPAQPPAEHEPWPAERQVLYIVDAPSSIEEKTLVVRLACRDRKSSGEWSKPKTRGISFPQPADLPDAEDKRIMALLRGSNGRADASYSYDPSYRVPASMQKLVVPLICRTQRAMLRLDATDDELSTIVWDEEAPWEFCIEGRREESTQQYLFSGSLRRGEQRIPMTRPVLVLAGGVVFFDGKAAAVDHQGASAWMILFRTHRAMHVPLAQAGELLAELFSLPHLPRLEMPEELRVETVRMKPRPQLRVRAAGEDEMRPERLRAEVSFDYGGVVVRADQEPLHMAFQPQQRRLVLRDREAEKNAGLRLRKLGLRDALGWSEGHSELWFNQKHLPRLVRALVEEGWQVEADGKLYRRPLHLGLNVSSGIDWFELRGDVDFGGQHARLPDLLAAIKRGETMVPLSDGTMGMIPEGWLKQYALLAGMGTITGDCLRFEKNQVGLLDALLASQPEATCDEVFQRMRSQMRLFDGIQPADAPPGFIGELRPYQREGLAWFSFLEQFGFGGCLADDMGLGKTVQVLALLEGRRERRRAENGQAQALPPSLVVVPKSLVFNWKQEAARFTPELRVLDHTGIDRIKGTNHLSDYDVVITTYGTLRRDAAFLKDLEFDYVVLDEAQAVKNPASESAKAVRLVRGGRRLALSGTPVQNHLGDLWSLFDFLNPGMLGGVSLFNGNGGSLRTPDDQTRGLLSRALRPFILRRTKEQVARDLPPRLEQTICCELDSVQRKLYDELREHYRRSLLEQVARVGLGKSKLQILEALLRLRQAALHPGLIDKTRTAEGSAKLDMLVPRLEEIIEEGHKALVFSQFTSMLAIVRQRLDEQNLVYEYLDGQTKDRSQRVERFQSDPNCKLFLISLKAGGLGLNLTAADYVFLLDPWWNPAVEQQAIDRAHRIGQDKQVYACRLIAKDTVEEKVLSLQQSKRDLADAIITADNSLIRTLGRDDLELLLS